MALFFTISVLVVTSRPPPSYQFIDNQIKRKSMKFIFKFLLSSFLFLQFSPAFATCNGDTQIFKMNDPIDQKVFEITAKVYRPAINSKVKTPARART